MARRAYINRTILGLLPNPEKALQPLLDNEGMHIKPIGGLHNLSFADKLRWRDDVHGKHLLLIETAPSNRAEFYPDSDRPTTREGYNIQYVSFLNKGEGVYPIHSHNKNHIPKHPIAAVTFVAGSARATQDPVMVWMKEGRLHTPDFLECTVETQNFSVFSERFIRFYPDHDFLSRIIIHDLQEVWEDDCWIKTRFTSYQIITKSHKTPESGDPTTQDWVEKYCHHGFDLLSEEPFQDEEEEFQFLTDLVL